MIQPLKKCFILARMSWPATKVTKVVEVPLARLSRNKRSVRIVEADVRSPRERDKDLN